MNNKLKRILAFLIAIALIINPLILSKHTINTRADYIKTDLYFWNTKLYNNGSFAASHPNFGYQKNGLYKSSIQGGSGEWSKFSNRYTYCVANHKGLPGSGQAAYLKGYITFDNYQSMLPLIDSDFNFAILLSAVNYENRQSEAALKDSEATTEIHAIVQSIAWAATMGPEFNYSGNSLEEDYSKFVEKSFLKIYLTD